MNTQRGLGYTPGIGGFDADEIRRLVGRGKASGLIREGGAPAKIERDGLPAAAEGGVISRWVDVPPKLARQWLENNFRNRPLRDDVIAAYARDMANGVWVPTHQGVAFNDRDELIDGQHRLHAIVLCGRTVRMMATFGLPSKIEGREMTTMDAVDRGRPRSVADQLKIEHGFKKNGSIIAAVCASLGGLCFGRRTRRLSVGQTLEIYRAFEPAVNWLIERRARAHGLRQAGVLAGFALALAPGGDFNKEGRGDGDVPLVALMYQRLTGDDGGLRPRSAVEKLRAFLISDEAKLLTRGTDRGLAELVLQAVFLEMHKRTVNTLEPSLEGAEYFRGLQRERVERIAALFRLPGDEAAGDAAEGGAARRHVS